MAVDECTRPHEKFGNSVTCDTSTLILLYLVLVNQKTFYFIESVIVY
jgi:hypothetical protein